MHMAPSRSEKAQCWPKCRTAQVHPGQSSRCMLNQAVPSNPGPREQKVSVCGHRGSWNPSPSKSSKASSKHWMCSWRRRWKHPTRLFLRSLRPGKGPRTPRPQGETPSKLQTLSPKPLRNACPILSLPRLPHMPLIIAPHPDFTAEPFLCGWLPGLAFQPHGTRTGQRLQRKQVSKASKHAWGSGARSKGFLPRTWGLRPCKCRSK